MSPAGAENVAQERAERMARRPRTKKEIEDQLMKEKLEREARERAEEKLSEGEEVVIVEEVPEDEEEAEEEGELGQKDSLTDQL